VAEPHSYTLVLAFVGIVILAGLFYLAAVANGL